MNKLEFLEAMKAEPRQFEYGKYSDINCVPAEIADAEVFSAWYDHVVGYCGAGPDTTLVQIPLQYVTDELRRKAISKSVRSLIYIEPGHTEAYRDLVIYGLSHSHMAFLMMDDSLQTTEFLAEVVDKVPGVIDLKWNSQDWVHDAMTTEIRDKEIKTGLEFALSLPAEEVTWDEWKHLFTTQPRSADALRLAKRTDLFVRFLQEGGWPDYIDGVDLPRPCSVEETATTLMKTLDDTLHEYHIYKAKLMSFPVHEVVAVMNTDERLEVLMEFYPEKTLRQNMKHSRALRGRLLENDLGM